MTSTKLYGSGCILYILRGNVMALGMMRLSVSPIPMGRTPELLSRAIRWLAISGAMLAGSISSVASSASNSLNRETALNNIQRLCLSLALPTPALTAACPFVIFSQEGTTQGDPLAMLMYAMATIPLIKKLKSNVNDVNQVWYADDVSDAGKVNRLREWWDLINREGLKYGYYTNASKTWLVCKEDCLLSAVATFADTDVKVTSEGRPYLRAALGSEEYIQSFVTDNVLQWVEELEQLASIAHSQPHAAHTAFTHGMTSKWTICDLG